MRVLMLSVEYPPVYDGGLGIAVAALSSALADQGVAVDVVTRGPAAATERDGAVTVHRVAEPDRSAIADEGYSAFLRWVDALADRLVATGLTVARERGVDVVHGHEWHAGAAARRVAAGADRPLVATIHATERGKAAARRTAPRIPVATAERTLARAAQAVTVASDWLAAELEAGGLARERIAVLPFGVELRAAPAASAVRRARRALAAPEHRPILLAGRLVSEKGFQDAIAALPLLRRDEPDASLALAGEGWYEPALRKATARAGVDDRVRFLGRLEPAALPRTTARPTWSSCPAATSRSAWSRSRPWPPVGPSWPPRWAGWPSSCRPASRRCASRPETPKPWPPARPRCSATPLCGTGWPSSAAAASRATAGMAWRRGLPTCTRR